MSPILDNLVSLEDVPLELLSAFSSAFQLDIESAYLSRAKFLIHSTEGTNLKERMMKIVQVLDQLALSEVLTLINSARGKISPYNYELQKCLLAVLYKLQPDSIQVKIMLELLDFLMDYQRCIPPGIMEREASFYRLPGLSEWPLKRLPFYYYGDTNLAKSIYHEEFLVSNWSVWYNSSSLVPLNRDEICMLAVHNSVKRYNKDNHDPVLNRLY